jgi:glycosyltransferase involved in cell wall biosynthesis
MKLISIVIPTKNSGKTLEDCLRSLKAQTYRHFEIIVVDGNSSDSTKEIAGKYGARFFTSSGSVPAARNLGFSKAKGTIFVSLDSDMIAQKELLSGILAGMNETPVLIIPEEGYGRNFLSRCKALEKSCYLGDPAVESARAFSRKAFTEAGGYDERLLLAEDRDLHFRFAGKFKIGRTKARIFHNTEHLTLSEDLRKNYCYGKSLPRYLSKGDSDSGVWLSGHSSSFFRYLGCIRKDPVAGMGLIALRAIEYSAGTAGFIVANAAAMNADPWLLPCTLLLLLFSYLYARLDNDVFIILLISFSLVSWRLAGSGMKKILAFLFALFFLHSAALLFDSSAGFNASGVLSFAFFLSLSLLSAIEYAGDKK